MKRKILCITAMLSLLLSFSSFAYEKTTYEKFQNGEYKYYQLATSEDVNMRMGPSKNYPIYKVIPGDTIVSVIRDNNPSGWYEIWYDSNSYYIYGDYIKYVEYKSDVY